MSIRKTSRSHWVIKELLLEESIVTDVRKYNSSTTIGQRAFENFKVWGPKMAIQSLGNSVELVYEQFYNSDFFFYSNQRHFKFNEALQNYYLLLFNHQPPRAESLSTSASRNADSEIFCVSFFWRSIIRASSRLILFHLDNSFLPLLAKKQIITGQTILGGLPQKKFHITYSNCKRFLWPVI